MITNNGRNILAKYLLGQAESYASHIAIGIGPEALAVGTPFDNYATKANLDFEVLRMPITSRGFVFDDDGNPNIVFTAEIPSDQRYEITEVGVYPGRINPSAGSRRSRILFTFGENENWEYHTETASNPINTIVSPLNLDQPTGSIAVTDAVFRTNSNNTLFNGPLRTGKNERPRFLDRTLMVKSDISWIETDFVTGNLVVRDDPTTYYGSHIHYNGISIDLDAHSLDDELRLAFSVMDQNETAGVNLNEVRLLIEFANADTATALATARSITLTGDVTGTASFDGTSNVTIAATVPASAITISDVVGLQTEIDTKAELAGSASQAFSASTLNATTVDLGDWTLTESAGTLYFATGGTNRMKLDANGNLTVAGNVDTNGTV